MFVLQTSFRLISLIGLNWLKKLTRRCRMSVLLEFVHLDIMANSAIHTSIIIHHWRRIATNEVLSSDSHWSLIRRSIWLSDSWHPLPVPHPDSWSWWSSWLSPRTVVTVSCPVIGTRAGSGITRQLLFVLPNMERLETLNHIFQSFCLFWENEEQQEEIYHLDLTPDWCWLLGRLQRPWYSGVCRGKYFANK